MPTQENPSFKGPFGTFRKIISEMVKKCGGEENFQKALRALRERWAKVPRTVSAPAAPAIARTMPTAARPVAASPSPFVPLTRSSDEEQTISAACEILGVTAERFHSMSDQEILTLWDKRVNGAAGEQVASLGFDVREDPPAGAASPEVTGLAKAISAFKSRAKTNEQRI